MPDPLVTVVVLTYNRAQEVLRTVHHLSTLEERPSIIVVDNGSTDQTVALLANTFPTIEIVRLPCNLGAAARNAGVRQAVTPYVALCDDDTWWTTGSLRVAADVLDRCPRVAVVCGKVLIGPDEREDPTSRTMAESPLPPMEPYGVPILGFLAGASMVRRQSFLAAGGFEPQLFLGGEEMLLAYDLAEAGWSLIYLPAATVHHHPSGLRDRRQRRRLEIRNALWTAWLRRPISRALRVTARTLAIVAGAPSLLPAFRDALKGRKWVQANRRMLTWRVERQIRLLESSARRPDRMSLPRQSAHHQRRGGPTASVSKPNSP